MCQLRKSDPSELGSGMEPRLRLAHGLTKIRMERHPVPGVVMDHGGKRPEGLRPKLCLLVKLSLGRLLSRFSIFLLSTISLN